jgi:hypothetical protein
VPFKTRGVANPQNTLYCFTPSGGGVDVIPGAILKINIEYLFLIGIRFIDLYFKIS